ncbi:hypothetical protein PsYK624_015050 [Phanerochaete sordida]|uniref:Uncharacterized protein n=1 Tax=Phanerochaete sordida TaxID=48140 RepID=A0A9P3FZH1_9APHY|nr:hypothetical protein PsYK624_015050 [Phanerochaete sordida]
MTEYTSSSDAIREYLSARDRTARWVTQHHGYDDELLSPSVPPSILSDSDAPSYGPSDSEESSDSIPPRMFLRWNDGRADVPISRRGSNPARPRTQSHSHTYSRRDESPERLPPRHSKFHPGAGSHRPSAALVPSAHSRYGQTLSYASVPPQGPFVESDDTPPPSPEHIVVLPSPQDEDGPQVPGTTPSHGSHQSTHRPARTHSMHYPQPKQGSGMYPPPSHQTTIHAPNPRRAYNPSNTSHVSRHATHSPAMQQSHSQPLPVAHGGAYPSRPGTALPYQYAPPQIVYAPSSKQGSTYAPPQIVYSPSMHPQGYPARGAPSIAYSQSAPLPHPHHGMSTAPPPGAHIVDDRSRSRGHSRAGSVVQGGYRGRSGSVSVARRDESRRGRSPARSDSDTSGSTYYILPTPGQKVQIIPPSGAPSLRTATSATKASQHSAHSSPHDTKKPFFQRIFHIPKLPSSSTASSSSAGRKLRRRHTLQVGAHALGES